MALETLRAKNKDLPFLLHWGASSGGVLDYKVNKFKNILYTQYNVYFGKINSF
jgi:hypothetical protein